MFNFFEKLISFLKKINHDDQKYFGPIPVSYGFISPGDILSFDYVYIDKRGSAKGASVVVLVVSVDRGPGIFLSSRNNKLLACFIIDDISPTILNYVISAINNNKGLLSYKTIKASLGSLFGSWNFITYDLSKIRGLQKVQIDLNKLETRSSSDIDMEN
jgi:hypothetical protein